MLSNPSPSLSFPNAAFAFGFIPSWENTKLIPGCCDVSVGGCVCREEAEHRMAGQPDGSFLIRDSSVPGDFTLIVR